MIMSESVEIEFKTFLTETEYVELCTSYQLQAEDFFTQKNIYYDTASGKLREAGAGLRIRIYSDHAEATLKTKRSSGLLETTDSLTVEEANKLVEDNRFLSEGTIIAKLKELGVSSKELNIIADLTTKRAEFTIAEGLLAIDESWYSQQHDYELELEVQEAKKGKVDFLALLEKFQIAYRPSPNKIQRAVEARKRLEK